MNRDFHSWERLSGAARRAARQPGDPIPDSPPIPWLPDLELRVREFFMRLLWRRWAILAALLAAAVLIAVHFHSRRANPLPAVPPQTPSLPLPPLP